MCSCIFRALMLHTYMHMQRNDQVVACVHAYIQVGSNKSPHRIFKRPAAAEVDLAVVILNV